MLTIAFIVACIVAGTLFLLWQDEHEKLIKAEKQIKDLKRQLKMRQNSGQPVKLQPVKLQPLQIKPQPPKPFLDPTKLMELQKQTRESQEMLAEIFN